MKKSIILLIIGLTLLSIACSKNKDVNTASNTRNSSDVVKIRTIQHIKKYGLKIVLINNEKRWYGPGGKMTIFKNDGRGYYNYRDQEDRLFYWKVINNKLYINPNKQLSSGNKFVRVKIEVTGGMFASPGSIEWKDIKYAIVITGPNESFRAGGQTYFK
jgi:hypothetical protein